MQVVASIERVLAKQWGLWRRDGNIAGDTSRPLDYFFLRNMSVVIPDEVLESARLSEGDVRLELAVALFQQERLTLAQAARLAGMDRMDFQQALASRRIAVHYDVGDFEADRQTLRDLGRL